MLELDSVHTLAFAGLALLAGAMLCRWLPVLNRYNIPAPVVGGLLVATTIAIARSQDITLIKFDTSLQSPLMIAFFTSVGFSASPALLRSGGPQMVGLLGLISVLAIVQNLIGGAIAMAFGLHPLFGVLSGSVTLTGGPATGLAFAPLFEQAGVQGAATIAVAAAMAGIVSGSVLGGPLATILIERYKLRAANNAAPDKEPTLQPNEEQAPHAQSDAAPHQEPAIQVAAGQASHLQRVRDSDTSDSATHAAFKNLVVLLVAMWIGAWISRGVASLGVTLPAYVGAMIAGAGIRTLDDFTGWIGLSQRTLDILGSVCLSLFLAVALMTLKLWELAGLALPLAINLLVQIAVVALFCVVVFRLMGRDYDAAVMSGGYVGFMMGTTANAMAVMRTLVERYGPAPRAFLVAPIVGAFFLDFTNALIITTFVNVWR